MSIEGLHNTFVYGNLILDNCNLSELRNEKVTWFEQGISAANNKISVLKVKGAISGSIDLSNNMFVHRPEIDDTATLIIDGNPVQPSDYFDEARW
jgi:hypothetical protein